jgi:hypothetical protein
LRVVDVGVIIQGVDHRGQDPVKEGPEAGFLILKGLEITFGIQGESFSFRFPIISRFGSFPNDQTSVILGF